MTPVGPAIAALGVTQIVGWGTTHYMPAVLAAPTAAGLGLATTTVLGALSWGLLVAGLAARTAGRLIDRHGARKVMSAASAVAALGLLVLAGAQGLAGLLVGWTLIGLVLRTILYDGAFAALAVIAGAGARRAISMLTLLGGLASTIFWPIGHWLSAGIGWRETLLCYAALNLLVCVPLHWRFTAGPAAAVDERGSDASRGAGDRPPASNGGGDPNPGFGLDERERRAALWTLAIAFTLQAFVASTMAAHLVMLLDGLGLGAGVVVSAAALMGIAQVVARLLEMLSQRWFDAVAVAPPSVALLPAAFVVALAWPGSPVAAALFVILYGCANGLFTIVRGALPLAVFGSRGYGELLGTVAGPALAVAALAPVTFSALVDATGTRTGLWVLAALSLGSFAAISVLAVRVRRWTRSTDRGAR